MALERNATLARAQQAQVDILEGKDPDQDDSGVRAKPRHHADLRRPQPPPHLACASRRHTARSAHSRRRRHGRSRVSAVSVTGDARRTRPAQGISRLRRRRRQDLPDAVRGPRAARSTGVDVVIGYFEPHGRQETIALSEGLETVPRKTVDYRGARFEEMDTEAILRRHPEVAIVDEFPHTNVPGSARLKRWEDVTCSWTRASMS